MNFTQPIYAPDALDHLHRYLNRNSSGSKQYTLQELDLVLKLFFELLALGTRVAVAARKFTIDTASLVTIEPRALDEFLYLVLRPNLKPILNLGRELSVWRAFVNILI